MKHTHLILCSIWIACIEPAIATQPTANPSQAPDAERTAISTRYMDLALEAAGRVKDDAFRADGVRADVIRLALGTGANDTARKSLAAMNPTDYRLPMLIAEWILRGGKQGDTPNPQLTMEHAWNLGVTLAPRRRAESIAAMRAGFPELATRPLPTMKPLLSGVMAAEVAEFRFRCLALFSKGKFPGDTEWKKVMALVDSEKFSRDPEGMLLADLLTEIGFEFLRRENRTGLAEVFAAIEATLRGSKVPSLPQGIGFCHLLVAAGEIEKATPLLESLSATSSKVSPRNPMRTDFESHLLLIEALSGKPDRAKQRSAGLTTLLETQMDYEQFIHGGKVIAALVSVGETGAAEACLKRLVALAEKNDNPNNLRFLQAHVALALASLPHVTKVSHSIPAEFDTLLGRP